MLSTIKVSTGRYCYRYTSAVPGEMVAALQNQEGLSPANFALEKTHGMCGEQCRVGVWEAELVWMLNLLRVLL